MIAQPFTLGKILNRVVNSAYLLLIFLFTYTGSDKLLNHDIFYAHLIVFPFINPFAGVISFAVPAIELVTAALLIAPSTRICGLGISLILLLSFTTYLLIMVASGVSLPCSCGGVVSYLSWHQHIVFNLFFIAVSIINLFMLIKRTSINMANSYHKFSHI